PFAPAGPVSPCAPVAPCGPCAPVAPCGPCAPVAPCGPVGPIGPVGPCEPAGPCGPVGPVSPVGPVGPIAPVPVDKTTSSSWLLQVSPDGTARRPPLELMQTLSVVSVCATKGRHPYATPDSARKERMRTQTAMMRERSNMLERLGVSRLLAVSTFAHPPG